jgi:hypothetical protein
MEVSGIIKKSEQFMKKYTNFILFFLIFISTHFTLCFPQAVTGGSAAGDLSQPVKPLQQEPLLIDEAIIADKDKSLRQTTLKQEAEASVTFIPSVKSKDNNSHIEIIESEFDYSCEYKLFEQIPVTFSLASEYIGLNENAQIDLPSHLTGLSAGVDVILPFFNIEKTYINLGVSPSMYRDDWSFETSSFRIPATTFLIYKPDDKWVFIAGLAFLPDYKDQFFPAAGFVYKPNEKWIFNITTDDPSIAYSPNEKLTIFTQMELPLGAEYEVTRGDLENTVLIYNDMRLGCGINYKINKFMSVSVSGGGVFDRYIKYRKVDEKISMENGGFAKFSVDIEI